MKAGTSENLKHVTYQLINIFTNSKMPPKRICFSGARTDLVIFDANSLKLLLRPPVSLFPATRVIERGEEMSKYNSALLRPKCSRPIRNTQDRVKII